MSPNAAPATKSDNPTSPNTAPATQNESHDWSASAKLHGSGLLFGGVVNKVDTYVESMVYSLKEINVSKMNIL